MKRRSDTTQNAVPCVLTIGGLDPSGGAGLPADARAMRSFGAHSCAIATAVIVQNTRGVTLVEAVSTAMLCAQIENLLDDIRPRAVKIGLTCNVEQVEIVRETLEFLPHVSVVLDPVFAPTTGVVFSDDATVCAIAQQLFPLCALVTPNAVEAARLCGFPLSTIENLSEAARCIAEKFGAPNVLVKGGHLPQSDEVTDVLWRRDESVVLRAARIEGDEVRGTGCLLASAIAAQLAQNVALEVAVERAKSWLSIQIENAQKLGEGRRIAL